MTAEDRNRDLKRDDIHVNRDKLNKDRENLNKDEFDEVDEE